MIPYQHHVFLRLHFFFFNDTATTEIYTLSLHDALPISSTPSSTVVPRCSAPPYSRTWIGRERCARDEARRSSCRQDSSRRLSACVSMTERTSPRRSSGVGLAMKSVPPRRRDPPAWLPGA